MLEKTMPCTLHELVELCTKLTPNTQKLTGDNAGIGITVCEGKASRFALDV